jgi:hypothetical protein
MAMEENASVFFEVCAGDGLAAGMLGIEGRGPQDDVLAVEGAVALADRHGGLLRVVPHGGEAVGFGIEAGDSGAGALGSVCIEEGEVRLQKLAVLDHVLLARALRHDRVSVHGEERLDDVPVAHELREELLTGARRVWWFVLIMSLLRECGSSNEQRRDDPFLLHSSRIICEKSPGIARLMQSTSGAEALLFRQTFAALKGRSSTAIRTLQ